VIILKLEDFYTVKQAEKFLSEKQNCKIGINWIEQLCHKGAIPAEKIGRMWLIDKKILENYTPSPRGRPYKIKSNFEDKSEALTQ